MVPISNALKNSGENKCTKCSALIKVLIYFEKIGNFSIILSLIFQKWRRARSESSSNQSRKKLEEIKQKSESAVDLAAVNGDSVEETADNQGQSAVEQLASEIVAIKEESDE